MKVLSVSLQHVEPVPRGVRFANNEKRKEVAEAKKASIFCSRIVTSSKAKLVSEEGGQSSQKYGRRAFLGWQNDTLSVTLEILLTTVTISVSFWASNQKGS